jgi:conjugative transfer pilus assembly protein TraH
MLTSRSVMKKEGNRMRGKRAVAIVLVLTVFISLMPASDGVTAGFIDDWLSQKTQSSPDYFEGQKRGYFSGGSFSARWKQSNDFIASFDAPKLKFGCGGIDAFMGGFSFLNAEYLVQKLQRIMQAAPAMAFDMALNVLCEPCSNIMKSMEALSNYLNQLQLDDCRAGKVVAAQVLSQFSDNSKIKAEADKTFSLTTGLQDLGQKLTETWKSNNNESESTVPEMTAGCPAEVNAIFNTGGKTVLEALGELRGLPSSHVDLMRGLIGDVKVVSYTRSDGRTDTEAVYVAPCPENAFVNLDAIYTGDVYTKSKDETCSMVTDTNANITTWVNTQLSSVSSKISSAGILTPSESGFLEVTGLPIHNALKMAIATNQSPLMMAMLSDTTAKTYAFSLIKDAITSARHSVQVAYSAYSKAGQAQRDNCQTELFSSTIEAMKFLDKTGTEMMRVLYADYQKVLTEMNSYDDFAQRYEDYNNIAMTKLSVMFKPSVVQRAVGQQ